LPTQRPIKRRLTCFVIERGGYLNWQIDLSGRSMRAASQSGTPAPVMIPVVRRSRWERFSTDGVNSAKYLPEEYCGWDGGEIGLLRTTNAFGN
jgi:hypothetical protein